MDGEDKILFGNACGNQLDDVWIDLELRELDGGDPILGTQKREEFVLLDKAEPDKARFEASALGLLVVESPFELVRGDYISLNEEFA
jgi:hypothetical protein